MRMISKVLLAIAGYQVVITAGEHIERHICWGRARRAADAAGKPLLVVGMQRFIWDPPNGDVTLDIDPAVARIPGGVVADERDMPFSDGQFGACYNAHTLEHLSSAVDVQMAVDECMRVADVVYILGPSPYSIVGNLFCPAHKLRLWFDPDENRIVVVENRYRTGLGYNTGIGQSMKVTRQKPITVIEGEKAVW